jgi:hypothetical protein
VNGDLAPKSNWLKQSTLSLKGEDGVPGRDKASVLGCFRGSNRRHAAKGFHMNKGDPSGSSTACRVRQAGKVRTIR